MINPKFIEVHNKIQIVIDSIAVNESDKAINLLVSINEQLDDLLDQTDEDEDLVEISKYQVLVNQLYVKVNPPEDEQ
jgi:hypothetical protein